MPGFPLAAIGAGLGQFAQNYQQQQAARERQMMLALTLQNFAQQQQDRQRREQATMAAYNLGSTDQPIGPVGPAEGAGVGVPLGRAMPAPQLPAGVGGAIQNRGAQVVPGPLGTGPIN